MSDENKTEMKTTSNLDVTSVTKDSSVVADSKKVEVDSDQETRSSAGSDDETDEEPTNDYEKNSEKVDK